MSQTDLADRHCRPVQGAQDRLADAEITALLAQLTGWERVEDGRALRKTFRFDDYYRTLAYVNALAHVAHREDHHPDLGVHYNRCVVRYSSHDADGLTENDFICAAKAERLYRQ
ncbi:MAG: 4a-hydroxytetrahydrobiopterin dehydratase [Lysobacteraceae bacterium]